MVRDCDYWVHRDRVDGNGRPGRGDRRGGGLNGSPKPQPTAHRAFTLLFAVLLVGSIFAPITAQPAAAAMQGGNVSENCLYALVGADNWCAEPSEETIDTEQAASEIETDIHVGATGVKSSQDATDQLLRNYLQDTDSIASMESRNALANAYQNGTDPAVADTMAQSEINDYYSRLQVQLLEETSVHSDQLSYYANISRNNPEIESGFVHHSPYLDIGDDSGSGFPTGRTVTHNVTLANGSVHEVDLPQWETFLPNSRNDYHSPNLFEAPIVEYNMSVTAEAFKVQSIDGYPDSHFPGVVYVLNSGSLESKEVYDYRLAVKRFREIENQSDTVVSNYDTGTADEFYTALDNGEIETEDLRGAEGMVRYLSGDANTTGERYQYALRSVLDMNRNSLDSTMVVEFDGATEETRVVNETDGSVSYEYNHVNETYEGLLFSSSTPANGFETGVTYNVSNLEGTQKMVTGGPDGDSSDVVFHQASSSFRRCTTPRATRSTRPISQISCVRHLQCDRISERYRTGQRRPRGDHLRRRRWRRHRVARQPLRRGRWWRVRRARHRRGARGRGRCRRRPIRFLTMKRTITLLAIAALCGLMGMGSMGAVAQTTTTNATVQSGELEGDLAAADTLENSETIRYHDMTRIVGWEFDEDRVQVAVATNVSTSVTISDALAGVGQEGAVQVPETTVDLERGVHVITVPVETVRGGSAVGVTVDGATVRLSTAMDDQQEANPFATFGGESGLFTGVGMTVILAVLGAWWVIRSENNG